MMRRSNWLPLVAVFITGCQFLQSRGAATTFTPEILLSATSPATPIETRSPASETQPPPSQTPFPPNPSDTPIPPSPTATPQPTPIPPAESFPDPAGYTWTPVVGGLVLPTDLTHAGDGSGRLFALEQAGRIRIIRGGQLDPAPFLDIRERVGSESNEQGLLGIAFHPQYAANGFFYVNYTDTIGDTVIARFQASDDPDQADPASEMQLLRVAQPFSNHNGGGLAFGPDGMLYVALGDGGLANDPAGNGQSLNTLLGKLLRLDVSTVEPYSIPPDNPFISGGGLLEIWSYGLRNPWRISFDSLTGDLYIGDVGQGQWEEIDFQSAAAPGGINYGWVFREGAHPFRGSPPAGLDLVDPVAEYDHGFGNCSVSGGFVYRGPTLPAWQGIYFYGDYCTGFVWGLLRSPDGSWQDQLLFRTGERITSFGVDEDGEIYLVGREGGIFRLAAQ